eukprot:6666120-Prymnesium_polylepis.1
MSLGTGVLLLTLPLAHTSCPQAKAALERAVATLLTSWKEIGHLAKADAEAQQGLAWDVAALRQMVRTDATVEGKWCAFKPDGKEAPNDVLARIVKAQVDKTFELEQVRAGEVGVNKGPLLGHLSSCTNAAGKVWRHLVVRPPAGSHRVSLDPCSCDRLCPST